MTFLILFLGFVFTSASDVDNAETVIVANNRFAIDVYKGIIKTNTGNIINSPFSAEVVLALLDAGCNGSTAEQLSKALYLPNNKDQIKTDMKSLLVKTNSSIFNAANAIFVQENYKIKQSFHEIAADYFLSETKNLDFSKNTEAAETINNWVESKTNNTITNLVLPNSLDRSTRVVLVNAVHFLAKWKIPFFKNYTKKDKFYKSPTDVIEVDFMHNFKQHFNYYYSDTRKVEYLQLPLQYADASMIFILPKNIDGISDVEKQLSSNCMHTLSFKSTYINVAIPKFKFDSTIQLTDILKELNITKIFDPTEADLTGIAGKKGDLIVSTVIQKAFIDLGEEGVEAAAATVVHGGLAQVVSSNRPIPISFVANRPFLFVIVYQKTIIFSGRVSKPGH